MSGPGFMFYLAAWFFIGALLCLVVNPAANIEEKHFIGYGFWGVLLGSVIYNLVIL